ncbi:hypothetical protein NQ318_022708 [Aromia moschata]|uniref:Uncharacterized protein n=1 Tax=Aromia moschata TaxID=1265417 RepID=A0AAV8YDH8_9CUCU|nr:hypothetical protein NQ318_022708 [Aromia moschata]
MTVVVQAKLGIKAALVTGANKGIGYQIALALAHRNYRVIMADKNCQEKSVNKIVRETSNTNILTKYLDLGALKSVKCFAEDVVHNEKKLDVLINNAGVFCMEKKKSCDGLDHVMQINHLGPLLLTNLLLDTIKNAEEGRILFVTSVGAFFHNLSPKSLTEPMQFFPGVLSTARHYYNSKLCNMIVSKMFAKQLEHSNITCNCYHPGMTSTDFLVESLEARGYLRKCFKFLTKRAIKFSTRDAADAAGLAVFLATSDSVKNVTGSISLTIRFTLIRG